MNGIVAFSIVMSVLAAIISIWGARWMRMLILAALFLFAADVTTLRFDNIVRAVAGTEIAKESYSVAYVEGVTALRNELFPYMNGLFIVCCGLLVLGISRKR
jgi:hypothetical protein